MIMCKNPSCKKEAKKEYCSISCVNKHLNAIKSTERAAKRKLELETFTVICKNCDKEFNIQERKSLHPIKDRYFCSKTCSSKREGCHNSFKVTEKANNCSFCEKTFKNKGGLSCHSPYCKLNPERVKRETSPNSHAPKGSIPWNKGLTRKDDPRIKSAWNKGTKGISKGRATTEEKETLRKLRISEKAKLNNGGYRQGSGRGKKGWFRGIFCDSSWELAYVMYHTDNNIPIKRCKEKRKYEIDGLSKTYLPDFVVNDSEIVEIKGYVTKSWIVKYSQNKDVKVLYENDIVPFLDYAKEKYGENFVDLYEKPKKDVV